jgi:hypothetical protein
VDSPDVEGGVEVEDTGRPVVTVPYDPARIRIETRSSTVDLLVKRIREGAIELSPEFQRASGLWKDDAQSRLIESLIIRIPIPAFYFDGTDEDRWLVVDGLQRLTTLKRFLVDKSLALTGLEFHRDLEGHTFDGLPRMFQRRIEETQLTVYVIQAGSPAGLKYNIFKRINTGGLPLSAQEIRHALNQGPATRLLKELAESPEFKQATDHGIRTQRMHERECVLRFFAFVLTPPADYGSADLDSFLNDKMVELNGMSEARLGRLVERFFRMLDAAVTILDVYAFRKLRSHRQRGPVNKALFEAWSVNLEALSDDQHRRLLDRRESLLDRYELLCAEPTFNASVSMGTGDPARVRYRFAAVEKLLLEVLS